MHKDQIKMLYAFEQLIINTEDPEQTYDQEQEENDVIEYEAKRENLLKEIEAETDPYMKEQLM